MNTAVRRDGAQRATQRGWLVTDVDRAGDATVLRGHNGQIVRICVMAETDTARRMASAFRRVHRIEIVISDGTARAAMVGVGHRLPVRRVIPVTVALGFACSGSPTFVQSDAAPEE